MRSNHNSILSGLTYICLGLFLLINVPTSSHAQDTEIQEQQVQEQPNRAGNQIMDIIKKRMDKKTTMQSRSWHKSSSEKKEEPKTKDETSKEVSDEELTEDQKVWKKYKTMSDEAKAKKAGTKKGKNKDYEEEQEEASDQELEGKQAEEEEPKGGIDIILERYKNSQKSKGKLNSRSYGSIE